MAVTSLDNLKKYADGVEVELPGFVDDEPFFARLRRPSLMLLAQEGVIPNTLLSAAAELFRSGGESINNQNFKAMSDVFKAVARASLAEPSYEELESAGLGLTDAQLLTIYNYSQTGVDTLRRFRTKQSAAAAAGHGPVVPEAAK